MKFLIIVFVLFSSISLKAQSESENFYLAAPEISWKKVYETTKTKQELITFFKASDLFWAVETVGDTIFAKLKPQHVDETKTGVAGVPPIVNKTAFKGLVRIELKDKKYRIIFKNIILVGDGEILKKGEEQSFEFNFLTKEFTEYRPGFLKKPNSIYNTTFSELFEIKTKAKEEW